MAVALKWDVARTGEGALHRVRPVARGVTRPTIGPLRRRRASGPSVGLLLVGAIVIVAVLGPLLVPSSPAAQDLVNRLQPPIGFGGTTAHPLGTDALGRDLLARAVMGARLSLAIGLAATVGAGLIGIALGLIAGYSRGIVDRLVTWMIDVQMAIPFVVVAIAIAAALRPGMATVLATLVLTAWVGYARVVRLQTHSLRAAPWVEAARSLGVGRMWLLARHLLPNLVGPILVIASQQVAAMVLYEAALSYLGLGVGGNTITWGGMIADGQETLTTAWWVSLVPGAALALMILAWNLLGDAAATGRYHWSSNRRMTRSDIKETNA